MNDQHNPYCALEVSRLIVFSYMLIMLCPNLLLSPESDTGVWCQGTSFWKLHFSDTSILLQASFLLLTQGLGVTMRKKQMLTCPSSGNKAFFYVTEALKSSLCFCVPYCWMMSHVFHWPITLRHIWNVIQNSTCKEIWSEWKEKEIILDC